MRKLTTVIFATAGMIACMVLASPGASAQKLAKAVYYQAQAMGQSTQLGQNFGITLIIEEYSTPDDQKALFTAFSEKQNEGLVNALSKMKSKGRLSITGTLGYDVTYIRTFPMPDGGTKIRLVTNRPIRVGEAWSDSRSMDYNLSGMEIIISPDKKKNSGMLAPACQFKLDKENQIQLELLQNEWKLVNIQKR
ncbi:MAG: hypothetical protein ND866_15950 [Pyrinomonadaceae bacterium]|nr:hypothetical protein [Pyrinomonadaceae bacterium]